MSMLAVRLVTALCVVVLVAGCDSSSPDAPEPDGGGSTGQGTDDRTEANNTDGDVERDAGPAGRLALSGWVESVYTGGGVFDGSLEIRAVEVDAWGNLFLDVEGVSMRGGTYARHGISAVDDLGNRYGLVLPENERLEVSSETRMFGQLAFEGPVAADARRVDVHFNEGVGEQSFTHPQYVFEGVPLPGVGVESEAARRSAELAWEVGVTERAAVNEEVAVTVHSVETRRGYTIVDVTVANRSGEHPDIYMATGLTDDVGTRFDYEQGDEDDEEEGFDHIRRGLRVESGFDVDVSMAFLGVPPQEASTLTFTFNGVNGDRNSAQAPAFEFEIPIPEE